MISVSYYITSDLCKDLTLCSLWEQEYIQMILEKHLGFGWFWIDQLSQKSIILNYKWLDSIIGKQTINMSSEFEI